MNFNKTQYEAPQMMVVEFHTNEDILALSQELIDGISGDTGTRVGPVEGEIDDFSLYL